MIWKRYFFDRRKVIGMYVLIIVIFLLICNLNQLDNFLDIFYAVVITSFLGICYGIYDYIQYYSRYKELKIITNGIGGYASIIGCNTRKYHGLLIAPLTPPARRFLVLSKIDESIEIDGKKHDLYTNMSKNYISKRI